MKNLNTGSVLWKDNQQETLQKVDISKSCVDTATNCRILLIERTEPCTSISLSNSGSGKLRTMTKPWTQDVGPLTLITMVTWNLVTDSVQMKMIAARQV